MAGSMANILAVNHVNLYRAVRQKRYLKLGLKMKAKIKAWIRNGNPNVSHYLSLLEGWHQTVAGHKFDAIRHFETAALLAAKGGKQQDAGLAFEHLGMLYLEMQENDNAAHQFMEAIKSYQSYGSIAKVVQLEEKHSYLWAKKKPTEIFTTPSDGFNNPSSYSAGFASIES